VSQKTNFDFETIVRDDASDDGTQPILERLQREYPHRLKLILEKTNTFAVERASTALLRSASGKYIAFIEGDDYWSSLTKLQECVDCLERDESLSMVGHLTEIEVVGGFETDREDFSLLGQPGLNSRGTFPGCHTSSIVLRAETLIPRWQEIPDVPYNDMKIKMLAAESGRTLVIPKVMSVYRVHSGGRFSGDSRLARKLTGRRTALLLLPFCVLTEQYFRHNIISLSRDCVRDLVRCKKPFSAISHLVESLDYANSWELKVHLLAPPFSRRVYHFFKSFLSH